MKPFSIPPGYPVILASILVGGCWEINETGERSSHILESQGSQGVLVNVEQVDFQLIDAEYYTYVKASGIPNYQVTLTQGDIDSLNNRPKAATDFRSGTTTAQAGQTIAFGQDIGFNSNTENCDTTGGSGYWPPGPVCPTNQNTEGYFPAQPQEATDDCETGLGVIGYMANGTSIYNWYDGQTYNSEGTWQNLAPFAEHYDVDICGGHAAQGDYHHHFHSDCLAASMDDQASGHSPVYGTAADGYQVHGPWHASGVLAKSSWVKRDYSANSATGCGEDGKRSCVMVDPYDPSEGTTAADNNGPDIGAAVTSQSGNAFVADSGFYFEDYYHSAELAAAGVDYLDEHNGHQHDDLPYHYHLTVELNEQQQQIPAFPFIIGPRFKGQLRSNAITQCNTGSQQPPSGPPTNPPVGPPPPMNQS